MRFSHAQPFWCLLHFSKKAQSLELPNIWLCPHSTSIHTCRPSHIPHPQPIAFSWTRWLVPGKLTSLLLVDALPPLHFVKHDPEILRQGNTMHQISHPLLISCHARPEWTPVIECTTSLSLPCSVLFFKIQCFPSTSKFISIFAPPCQIPFSHFITSPGCTCLVPGMWTTSPFVVTLCPASAYEKSCKNFCTMNEPSPMPNIAFVLSFHSRVKWNFMP